MYFGDVRLFVQVGQVLLIVLFDVDQCTNDFE